MPMQARVTNMAMACQRWFIIARKKGIIVVIELTAHEHAQKQSIWYLMAQCLAPQDEVIQSSILYPLRHECRTLKGLSRKRDVCPVTPYSEWLDYMHSSSEFLRGLISISSHHERH